MTNSAGHKFDRSVLREYDVRGIVGDTLHAADANALGKAFGTMVRRSGGKRVALGRDGRLSSPELASALAEGILSTVVRCCAYWAWPNADAVFHGL